LFYNLSIGYGSSVAPTYINEVSPRSLRGTLGASFQLGIVIILFISQVISLHPVLGSANTWHYAMGKYFLFYYHQEDFSL
jgi:SP family facilitated glucose transporter-like MFS transporter 9